MDCADFEFSVRNFIPESEITMRTFYNEILCNLGGNKRFQKR